MFSTRFEVLLKGTGPADEGLNFPTFLSTLCMLVEFRWFLNLTFKPDSNFLEDQAEEVAVHLALASAGLIVLPQLHTTPREAWQAPGMDPFVPFSLSSLLNLPDSTGSHPAHALGISHSSAPQG